MKKLSPKILFPFLLVLLLFSIVKKKTTTADDKNLSAGLTAIDRLPNIRINQYYNLSSSNHYSTKLLNFYQNRSNKLAWLSKGRVNRNIRQLVKKLESSHEQGLPGKFYHLDEIESGMKKIKHLRTTDDSTISQLVQLDLLLTDSYIKYASDLSNGRLNPHNLDAEWENYPIVPEPDITNYLENALRHQRISKSLERLEPDNEQYELLKDFYNELREKKPEENWPLPGYFSKLEKNDTAANVVSLKKYLTATGDLKNNKSGYISSTVFDDELAEAVKIFQYRHGLKPDGIVGENTLTEMNKSMDYRLDQIKLNLDRLRWFPDNFGKKYIVINIPEYRLKYYQNDDLVQEMNVVVGKNEHFTPALKDVINSIVFNPPWNVPYSIATKELLPKIKNDSSWFEKNRYILLKGSYISSQTVDPDTVDWSKIEEDNFPFFIVQKSGGNNALGKIKFVMPNDQSIYLHDTPASYLFDRAQRDYSHGCIRLQKPVELAQILLEDRFPADSIQNFLNKKETRSIELENGVPVNIIYQTAWVNSSGQIEFRDDVYGFDKISLVAFEDNSQTANLSGQN